MNPDDRSMSRRRFLVAGGGGAMALLGLAGCGSSSASSSSTTQPAAPATDISTHWDSESLSDLRDLAYCIVLANGKWIGPRNSNRSIDASLVDQIVSAARRSHVPQYLRYTEINSKVGSEVPSVGTQEYTLTRQLVDAGLKLGVAIDVALAPKSAGECMVPPPKHGTKKPDRCVRSLDSIIHQAQVIKQDSDAHGGIYDWIFLDFAWDRTPAGHYGLDDLQEVVDTLARMGWSRVMINATGFGPKTFQYMPTRTWGIAHRFQLFVGNEWKTAADDVANSRRGALETLDIEFVNYVRRNRAGCRAILKLEDPTETERFAELPSASQKTLLQLWAQASDQMQYRMIYPLYVDGKGRYNSLTAQTFAQQLQLMQRYG